MNLIRSKHKADVKIGILGVCLSLKVSVFCTIINCMLHTLILGCASSNVKFQMMLGLLGEIWMGPGTLRNYQCNMLAEE